MVRMFFHRSGRATPTLPANARPPLPPDDGLSAAPADETADLPSRTGKVTRGDGVPPGEPTPPETERPTPLTEGQDDVADHGLLRTVPPPRTQPRWERLVRRIGRRVEALSAVMSSRPMLLGALCTVVAATAAGWNLFGYPRIKEDEGITSVQAFSILHGAGRGTFVAYRHIPGAPLVLAGWDRLTAILGSTYGLFEGLTTVERGRVLLVLLAMIQAPLLFFIVRRLTGLDLLATGAALLFALSPLELWFARWLEPDPFAAFWVTIAVAFAIPPTRGRGFLLRPVLAGVALGAAICSKEVAIVAAPGLGIILLGWPRGQRIVATLLGVLPTVAVPAAVIAWLIGQHLFFSSPDHASFLGVMTDQANRQHDGGFFNSGSHFWQVRDIWGALQPFFIILCGLATVWLSAAGRTPVRRGVGLMALGYWAFFASGLIVQDYYVAAALPVWVVATVLGPVDFFERGFIQRRLWGFGVLARPWGIATVFGLLLLGPAIPADALAFGAQDANIQAGLTTWLRTHVPANGSVIDDGSDTLDLRGSALPGRAILDSCNYYDSSCIHYPGVAVAYIVDDGELNYLAGQDPGGAGALRSLALSGELVWSAEGLTDNNFIHVMRVTLPAPA